MAQETLSPPPLTADEIKYLRRRYLEGLMSEAGRDAFEEQFPKLIPQAEPATGKTAPPVSPGDITLADMARIPFGAARGAISTTMGLPPDILSLAAEIGNFPADVLARLIGLPPRRTPPLPFGSMQARHDINRAAEALGLRTPPASVTERALETIPDDIASNVLMALVLRGLKVPPAISGGKVSTDIVMGTGAGAGRAIGAEAGETGEAIGGLVGGLSPALPRLPMQVLLRLLGVRGLTPQQRQIAQAFQRQGIEPLASDITGARGVAQLETLPTRFPIGVAPTQRFAERQLGQTQEAVQRALEPLASQVGPEEAGLAIRGNVSRQLEQQRAAAEDAARSLAEATGSRVTFVDVGTLAERDIKLGIKAFTVQKGQIFDAVERLAGDDPVVKVSNVRKAAEHIVEQSRQIGSPQPLGTREIARLGKPDANIRVGGIPVGELPESLLQALPLDLRTALESAQPITFALARRIETEMGRIAFTSRRAVPDTSVEGSARRLYQAIRQDIDEFLTSPSGANVAPKLAEAKQFYATQKRLFNDSVNRTVTQKGFAPEKFIERVFSPQADVTDLIDFKLAVSPRTYELATASLLAHGFDQAVSPVAGGVFQPEVFVRWAQPYLKNGRIEQILSPERAREFQLVVGEMADLGKSRITQLDKLLGTRDPEKLVPLLFDPRLPSRTRLARDLLDPDVYNDAVRAWAQKLYQDSLSSRQTAVAGQEFLSPAKLVTRLEPFVNSGQLEVILADFPQVAKSLRDLFPLLSRMGRSELLAGNPSGTAQAILGAGQVLSGPAAAIVLLRGIGTGDLPTLALSAALTGGMPSALGRFTTSRAGVRILSEGLEDKFSSGAIRFATRVLGAEAGKPEQPTRSVMQIPEELPELSVPALQQTGTGP